MDKTLKLLKNIQSECCVTIILNTHRTKPLNQKDPIRLKNLIKEAESRILENYDKRFSKNIIEKINKLADKINHNFNLDSLILFVNEDIAEFVRLAIPVKGRVIIDKTFATRDLIRSIHEEVTYFALVVSRRNARLLMARNDIFIKEFSESWPIENTGLFATDKHKLSTVNGQDNLIEEFFNRVDKVLIETIKDEILPVIVVTEGRNYNHYLKVADRKEIIVGHLNKNRDEEKPHHIIADAWETVNSIITKQREERISELGKAIGAGNLISDINEIYNAVNQGRGRTLFIKKGTFYPAILNNGNISPAKDDSMNDPGFIDDIIDEIIEINLKYGGDNIFLNNDKLNKFNGLALITRY